MTYQRLAYDDADSAAEMSSDCFACADQMSILPARIRATPVDVEAALGGAPSIEYADFPREVHKPEIRISDAAALLAARLHLHLD